MSKKRSKRRKKRQRGGNGQPLRVREPWRATKKEEGMPEMKIVNLKAVQAQS